MATQQIELTADEKAFFSRVALKIDDQGLDVAAAAKSVIVDDERLFMAFHGRGHSQYFPTPDDRGISHHTGARPGDVIVSHLSATVYQSLRHLAA